MANRTPKNVLGERTVIFGVKHTVNVISQPIFKLSTKHFVTRSNPLE
jgi:hypothetical protein